MSVPGGGRRAPAQVAEATFEVFHVEMVRLIQLQHPPAALVAAGMDEPAARALQQARVNEKLEAIGTAAGARLVEKITKDLSFLPTDPLSCVKFVCKELWHALFGKQVDKLQTNYRGMYVLHEACFPWLQRLPTADKALYEAYARPHAALVVGLVRGALAALGLAADARLELDLSQPRPVCLFVVNDVVAAANNNTTAGAGASAGAGAGNQGAGRTGAGGR